MKIYTVGGYVRDLLLAREGVTPAASDRDWVVVGATPEELLAKGFTPVGTDFPVFLHPQTHDEYALARTERKTAPGYHGFVFHASPEVTLEEDLRRRDLTINAIAMDESGEIIDPYGGVQDLQKRVFRHVSAAFSEDPVRILRVARFAARFPSFSIASETMALMRQMVCDGETDALIAERVFAELSRGLMAQAPVRMLEVLVNCGYWNRHYKSIPLTDRVLAALRKCPEKKHSLAQRFALLLSDTDSAITVRTLSRSLRTPKDVCDLAILLNNEKKTLTLCQSALDRASLLYRIDALRRPQRALCLFDVWETLTGKTAKKCQWGQVLHTFLSVQAGQIALSQDNPQAIAQAIKNARVDALIQAGFK